MQELNLEQFITKLESIEKNFEKLGSKGINEQSVADILGPLLDSDSKSNKSPKEMLDDLLNDLSRIQRQGQGSFNLYPSKNSISCQSNCIGIATKDFGHAKGANFKSGFKGVILDLIAYWLGCFNTNQFTLILTPDWNTTNFEKEWAEIIQSHCKTGKQVLIVELIRGNKFLIRFSS